MAALKIRNSLELRTTTALDYGTLLQQGVRLLHTYGTTNLFLGSGSGNYTLTSTNCIGIGSQALVALTSGSNNVCMGANAGTALTTGAENSLIGVNAGAALTTQNDHTVLGYGAFRYATSANKSVAIGALALAGDGVTPPTGGDNVAVGPETMQYFTTAASCVAVGTQALWHATSATNCIAVGVGALSGDGVTPPTGSNCIGIGTQSLYSLTSGQQNIGIGHRAMYEILDGQQNIGIGQEALRECTSGTLNTGVGTYALATTSDGYSNAALGSEALRENTSGAQNVGIGHYALRYSQTTNNNVAVGAFALSGDGVTTPTGIQNTAVGFEVLASYTTGIQNSGLGFQTLTSLTTGERNTALGVGAGYSNLTGDANVFIGFNAGYSETGSNKLYIANTNTATPLIAGDFSTAVLTINGDLVVADEFAIQAGTDNSSTGTLNDIATTGISFLRFTGAGAVTITGFADGSNGKVLTIINRTGNVLTINNEDTGSAAANRILTGRGTSMTFMDDASITFQYDVTDSRWNIVSGGDISKDTTMLKAWSWMGF